MVMPSGEQTRVPVCSGGLGEAGGANVLEALEAQNPDLRTGPTESFVAQSPGEQGNRERAESGSMEG